MQVRADYWAAADHNTIAQEIHDKFEEYRNWCLGSGFANRVTESYNSYYGFSHKGAYRIEKSQDNSISHVSVNHHRSLIKQIKNLITQNKLDFRTKARTTDYASRIATQLGDGLLQWHLEEKNLSALFSNAVEMALVCLAAHIEMPWDRYSGSEMAGDVTTGQVFKAGEQKFYLHHPLNVAQDVVLTDNPTWKITRRRVNRFELATIYPAQADAILSTGLDTSMPEMRLGYAKNEILANSDAVEILTLYHEKTEAMPHGRFAVVCGQEVLEYDDMRYDKVPVFRLSPGDVFDSVATHSPSLDVMSIQQALNGLISGMVTNQANLGLTSVWSQNPIQIQELSQGMFNLVSASQPQAINLGQSNPQAAQFLQMLIQQAQLLTAIPGTMRGEPETGITAGNALALLCAQAVQFYNDLQANYSTFASDVGTCLIRNVQRFGSEEFIALIGGKSKASYSKTFKADELAGVDQVSVELGNALTNTTSGRVQLADNMVQNGIIKSPQDYLSVITTGNLSTAVEPEMAEQDLIVQENELLKQGQTPPVVLIDNHAGHIMAHRTVFGDPATRSNPAIVQAVTAHIQEHIAAYKSIDPDLAAILNLPPLPSQQPAPMPQGPVGPPNAKPADLPEPKPEIAGTPVASPPPEAPPGTQQAAQEQQQALMTTQGM